MSLKALRTDDGVTRCHLRFRNTNYFSSNLIDICFKKNYILIQTFVLFKNKLKLDNCRQQRLITTQTETMVAI
jgi:hypothetical protein